MKLREQSQRKKKIDHAVAVEAKKWDHGIALEAKKLEWEREEKDKDCQLEIEKLDRLASQSHIGKKYDLVIQCVVSGKTTEEIERLATLFK